MLRSCSPKVTLYLVLSGFLLMLLYLFCLTVLQYQATRQDHGGALNDIQAATPKGSNNTDPKILCWLLLQNKFLETKGKAVKETWTRRCDKVLFFSSTTNETFPTVGLNITEGRSHLTTKSILACVYSYGLFGLEFDWFLKADDDTYVIMENLRLFVRSLNPNDPLYFGYRFKPYTPQGYMSGRAAYVLSREAMKRLVADGVMQKRCGDFAEVEDLDIGRCLYTVGVKAIDSLDQSGLETFHPLGLNVYLNDHYRLPAWVNEYAYHPVKMGFACCSNRSISFHYLRPYDMYILDYLIYHLKH